MNQIPKIEEVEQNLVKHLVDRFLGWRLPKDFHPDGGIMFMDVYDNGTEQGGKFEPVGTNLFTAEQAKEMFRFLLEHEDGTPVLAELLHQQLQRALSKVKELVNETHRTELREQHEEYVAGFQDACSLLWTKVDRYQSELDHLPDRPLNSERD